MRRLGVQRLQSKLLVERPITNFGLNCLDCWTNAHEACKALLLFLTLLLLNQHS